MIGQRIDRGDADRAANAVAGERLLRQIDGAAAGELPGNGIAIAELGQHTASGIVLIGVAQLPALPSEA